MEKANSSGEKLRETCRDYAKFSYAKAGTYGFLWQQTSYRCSFCNKEFRSAQALGGHMNIHRKERARMRLSPSLDGLNSSSDTNTNSSSSSSALSTAMFLPYKSQSSSFASFSSPIPSASTAAAAAVSDEKFAVVSQSECDDRHLTWATRHAAKNLNKRALLEVTELPVLTKRIETRVWKKKEVRLDLNMGFFRDAKDDLDLELRLGLS